MAATGLLMIDWAEPITDSGEINQSLAKPVDTSNMDTEEIDKLMKIVDDLRSVEDNDGSDTGN
jgi:hypothetical protein